MTNRIRRILSRRCAGSVLKKNRPAVVIILPGMRPVGLRAIHKKQHIAGSNPRIGNRTHILIAIADPNRHPKFRLMGTRHRSKSPLTRWAIRQIPRHCHPAAIHLAILVVISHVLPMRLPRTVHDQTRRTLHRIVKLGTVIQPETLPTHHIQILHNNWMSQQIANGIAIRLGQLQQTGTVCPARTSPPQKRRICCPVIILALVNNTRANDIIQHIVHRIQFFLRQNIAYHQMPRHIPVVSLFGIHCLLLKTFWIAAPYYTLRDML